jgi:tetratricopeptide (TPR) repeat protein
MKLIKKLLLILLIIITFFQQFFGIPVDIKNESDKFLDYLLTSREIINNENLLTVIGKAYASLGLHENALNLFSQLHSDYEKYTLLNHSVKSASNKDLKIFERIEKQSFSIEDKTLRIKLYLDLIQKYNELNLNIKAVDLYKNCYNEINLLDNADNFEDKIFLSIDLSFKLYNCGFQKEGDIILLEIHKIAEESKDIHLKMKIYEYIIYSYIEINDEEKASIYADKLNDLLMTSAGVIKFTNLNLLEAFISLGKYQYACDLANKIIKDKKGMNSLKEIYSLMVVSNFLICDLLNTPLSQKELEGTGETLIQLLIGKGDLKKAKEISEKFNAKHDINKNIDAYFFYLGKKYLNESSSRIFKFAALNLAYKILDRNKKIELMVEIAIDFQKNDENDVFLRIMNHVMTLTEGKNFTFNHGNEDLALIFLKAGFPNKALQLIETIEDKLSQSSDLYQFGTYTLIHYNKNIAEKVLLRLENDSVFKGLLLSKIASWYLIQGENDMALQLFKKAFDIIKRIDDGFLPSMIDDYINAKVYGRISE